MDVTRPEENGAPDSKLLPTVVTVGCGPSSRHTAWARRGGAIQTASANTGSRTLPGRRKLGEIPIIVMRSLGGEPRPHFVGVARLQQFDCVLEGARGAESPVDAAKPLVAEMQAGQAQPVVQNPAPFHRVRALRAEQVGDFHRGNQVERVAEEPEPRTVLGVFRAPADHAFVEAAGLFEDVAAD